MSREFRLAPQLVWQLATTCLAVGQVAKDSEAHVCVTRALRLIHQTLENGDCLLIELEVARVHRHHVLDFQSFRVKAMHPLAILCTIR